MGALLRIGTLLLALGLSAASGVPGPPPPDSCDAPAPRGALLTVELGASDANDAFVAWQPDAALELQYGVQGGTMIGFRLRVTGSDLVECMPQGTRVLVAGTLTEIAREPSALKFYAEPDGSRITRTNYLIFNGAASPLEGLAVTVETDVGGLTGSVSGRLVAPDTPPAPDAAAPDGA